MVNEGRGINDINKINIENIFNLFNEKGYGRYIISLFDKEVIVSFTAKDNYDSNFYSNNKNLELNFSLPYNYDNVKFKEIISHELNHLIEIVNIHNKKYRYPKYDLIKKSLIEYKPENDFGEFFKHLIYKTLDNEINATVAQTYSYLRSFDNNDEDFLRKKLKEYDKTIEYNKILSLNLDKLKKDAIINSKELERLNNLLLLNNVDSFYSFIVEFKYVSKWIEKWYKIISNNCKKLLIKQNNLIKEIIEDYDTGKVDENKIQNFKNYLQTFTKK